MPQHSNSNDDTREQWFRVPNERIDEPGMDFDSPKYSDRSGIRGFSGNRVGKSLQWVVKFSGTQDALDYIAEQPDTQLLTSEQASNMMNSTPDDQLPSDFTPENIDQRFSIGGQ